MYISMKYTKKLISCKIQGLKGKKSTFIGNINGLKQCVKHCVTIQIIETINAMLQVPKLRT